MRPENLKGLKEKKIQFFSRLKLRNIFPGEWESVYKGEGVEFADIKPFEPGDDLRDIDLHALVQSGEELVVQRVVERQMRVYVWADFSGSMQRFEEMLFSQKPEIRDIAIGLILFSAVKLYSPIGLYPFGLKNGKIFPPKIGEGYCQEILDWLSDEKNLRPFASSGIETALRSLLEFAQPRNMVFFISDFKQKIFEENPASLLRPAVSKFDFIPVVIRDPLEKEGCLKRSVRIRVQSSSEGGEKKEVYLTTEILQEIQRISRAHLQNLERNFKKLGIEHLVLDSSSVDECLRVFSNFFQARKRTKI